MDTHPPPADGRPMQGAGCAVTGCGCLAVLVAIVLAAMVAGGAVNHSAEAQAIAGAATSGCCGGLGLVVGLVLVIVGGRRRQQLDTGPA